MIESTRREFWVRSSAGLATTAASARRVHGANERIRLGVLGSGGRGAYLMKCLNSIGGIEWVAVNDVYDARRDRAEEVAGVPVKKYVDHRELLEHKDIDAVLITSTDHWHSRMALDALRAGKDIYLEKPLTSRLEDCKPLAAAVRRSDRVVQVGLQQRSMPTLIEAKKRVVDAGLLGKVGLVRTWYDSNAGYTFEPPPGMDRKPAGLDWERYLGPLPKIPWDPRKYFGKYAYWDFSTGGMTGGLFVHNVDNAHWFLGLDRPVSVTAGGGLYHYKDGRDTPDVISIHVKYPQGLSITFEGEIMTFGMPYGIRTESSSGLMFRGTGGVLVLNWEKHTEAFRYYPNPRSGRKDELSVPWERRIADHHLKNWLECIRSRKTPNSDIVSAYYSTMVCHMANLAYRSQSAVAWRKEWDLEGRG